MIFVWLSSLHVSGSGTAVGKEDKKKICTSSRHGRIKRKVKKKIFIVYELVFSLLLLLLFEFLIISLLQ